jgi:hypothetical protein
MQSNEPFVRAFLGLLNFVSLACGAALLYGGVGRVFSAAIIATVAQLRNCTQLESPDALGSPPPMSTVAAHPSNYTEALRALERAMNCTQAIGALVAGGLPPSLHIDERVVANALNPFIALVVAGAFVLLLSAVGLCVTAAPRRRRGFMAAYCFMLIVALSAAGYAVAFCALFAGRVHEYVRLYWIYVSMIAPPNWSAARVVAWFHTHVWLIFPAAVASAAMALAAAAASAYIVGWVAASRTLVAMLDALLLVLGVVCLAAAAVLVRFLIGGWLPPIVLGAAGAAVVASALAGACGVARERRGLLNLQIAMNAVLALLVAAAALACFIFADDDVASTAYARAHWREVDATLLGETRGEVSLSRSEVEEFVQTNFTLLGFGASLLLAALLASVAATSLFAIYVWREERLAERDFFADAGRDGGEGGALVELTKRKTRRSGASVASIGGSTTASSGAGRRRQRRRFAKERGAAYAGVALDDCGDGGDGDPQSDEAGGGRGARALGGRSSSSSFSSGAEEDGGGGGGCSGSAQRASRRGAR